MCHGEVSYSLSSLSAVTIYLQRMSIPESCKVLQDVVPESTPYRIRMDHFRSNRKSWDVSWKSGTPAWWFSKRDLDQFGDLMRFQYGLHCLHVSQLALKLSYILSFLPLILTGLTFLILPPPELGFKSMQLLLSQQRERWQSNAGFVDVRQHGQEASEWRSNSSSLRCSHWTRGPGTRDIFAVGPDWPAD